MLRICIAVLSSLFVLVSGVHAAPGGAVKVAVFPFDLRDGQLGADPFAQPQDADLQRLKLVAGELKSLMQKSGRYQVVDLQPFADEIEKARPFNDCDGCELDVAKKAGADVEVTGFVDKVTDALMSLQLFVRDVATGKVTMTMSAEIRGNTDELWLHGIRYLWKNRFQTEALQK